MKYELIAIKETSEKGNVALIKRGNKFAEYAVVRDLDVNAPMESDDLWSHTIDYWKCTVEGLQKAIECFRVKTEEDYISRSRLEELATKFLDCAFELADDKAEVIEYLKEECDFEEDLNEIKFFCPNEVDEFEEEE